MTTAVIPAGPRKRVWTWVHRDQFIVKMNVDQLRERHFLVSGPPPNVGPALKGPITRSRA